MCFGACNLRFQAEGNVNGYVCQREKRYSVFLENVRKAPPVLSEQYRMKGHAWLPSSRRGHHCWIRVAYRWHMTAVKWRACRWRLYSACPRGGSAEPERFLAIMGPKLFVVAGLCFVQFCIFSLLLNQVLMRA